MKLRIGFVSNSSSSSFVIAGARLQFDDITPKDVEKKNIYCLGKSLDEGTDYFRLDKQFYDFFKKHDKALKDMIFYEVMQEGEDGFTIKQQDFKGKAELEIYPFTADYHSTEDLNTLKQRYLDED